jgi:hypothetical protein
LFCVNGPEQKQQVVAAPHLLVFALAAATKNKNLGKPRFFILFYNFIL